jgi:hypothetical protein
MSGGKGVNSGSGLEAMNCIIFGSSLFCVDILKNQRGLELKIILSIETDEEPHLLL